MINKITLILIIAFTSLSVFAQDRMELENAGIDRGPHFPQRPPPHYPPPAYNPFPGRNPYQQMAAVQRELCPSKHQINPAYIRFCAPVGLQVVPNGLPAYPIHMENYWYSGAGFHWQDYQLGQYPYDCFCQDAYGQLYYGNIDNRYDPRPWPRHRPH